MRQLAQILAQMRKREPAPVPETPSAGGTTPLERRSEPRERLRLPVLLRLNGGLLAVTRDISASGMYLELQHEEEDLGGSLEFDLSLPELNLRFTAQGRIVRVEQLDGHTGVAVMLQSQRIEPLA